MTVNDARLLAEILDRLKREGGEGLRVSDLRKILSGDRDKDEIRKLLVSEERQGRVRRDPVSGRWTLTSAPPPSGTGPTARNPRPLRPRAETPDDAPPFPAVPDARVPPPAANGARADDPSQSRAINAPASARQVIEAGPGFGKTDVACARLVHLVRLGIAPPQILLISFTRTAVREIRRRVAELTRADVAVRGVDVRTLDSLAWRLRTLATGSAPSTYDSSIQDLLDALDEPTPELLAEIERFAHVFVDEAQDLIGARAKLVARLLELLPETSGFTVFHDPAQAIYGWTSEDLGEAGATTEAFSDMVEVRCGSVSKLQLDTLHRTRDPDLRRLLLGARHVVLHGAQRKPMLTIHSELRKRAPTGAFQYQDIPHIAERAGVDPNDLLVLFRHRYRVLDALGYFCGDGKSMPVRVRMGGLPRVSPAWIAMAINEHYARCKRLEVTREEFAVVWSSLSGRWNTQGVLEEDAWRVLRTLGRPLRSGLDLSRVPDRLAGGNLPDEAFHREIGGHGPVLGTIHGSKGREAATVVVHLDPECDDANLAEARVAYVALSRAKQRLMVNVLGKSGASKLPSGRIWKTSPKGVRVEVGRERDLEPVASLLGAGTHASAQQNLLGSFDGRPRHVFVPIAFNDARRGRVFAVADEKLGDAAVPLGALTDECLREVGVAAHAAERRVRPGQPLRFPVWLDVASVGLRADDPQSSRLPEPWRTTRTWLAPVVLGLGMVFCTNDWKKTP